MKQNKIQFISMKDKELITENKVILNEQGEVEFLLTEETQKLGYFSIEEGKCLGAQLIQEMASKKLRPILTAFKIILCLKVYHCLYVNNNGSMNKKAIHINHLDLGHNLVIENDELKTTLAEGCEGQDLSLDEAFAELIEMADKIDKYYEQHDIQN